MDPIVFAAVLTAAACHATWNALLKIKLAPLLAISLISTGCGLTAVPFLFVVDVPGLASVPYLAASLVIHFLYYIALAEAYRVGDLTQAYPIARGTAPLMTAIGANFLLGEVLGLKGWLAVGLVATGIIMLARRSPLIAANATPASSLRSIIFALLTAAMIALYTLIDGTGARLAASSSSYIVWLLVFDGLMMTLFGIFYCGRPFIDGLRHNWQLGLAGGGLSSLAYAIVIWAMTVAPIALVAALRETSVLFAALIGIFFLREPIMPVRIAGAVVIVAGVLLLRFR